MNDPTIPDRSPRHGGETLTPRDVAQYYETWTTRYLSAFGDTIQANRPTQDDDLHRYLMSRSGLRSGKHVLDAGCGVCGPARYFVKNLDITVEALTVSPIQAEIARKKNREFGLSGRINVTVGDFHELVDLYGREAFDLAYYLESLSHSPNPKRAAASVYEVLKPGGIIYIKDYFIRKCDSAEEQQQVLAVVSRVDHIFSVKTAWVERIIEDLRDVGFLSLRIEPPQFETDNTRWQLFEQENELDLFAGQESFDWSEWWELKFQKP